MIYLDWTVSRKMKATECSIYPRRKDEKEEEEKEKEDKRNKINEKTIFHKPKTRCVQVA